MLNNSSYDDSNKADNGRYSNDYLNDQTSDNDSNSDYLDANSKIININ